MRIYWTIPICFLMLSCAQLNKMQKGLPPQIKLTKTPKIKRSWVRRLAHPEDLRSNSIAQNFNPLVKENGNVVQASSFSGVSEFNKYGRRLWTFENEDGVGTAGSGSLYKNFVFFGSQDKKLYAYDSKEKKTIWTVDLPAMVSSISEFNNGKIYVLTEDGGLHAVQASDGSVDWTSSFPTRRPLKIYGSPRPVLGKGNVIAGFPNGTVAAFKQSSGEVIWRKNLEGGQKHSDVDFLTLSPDGHLVAGVFDVALYRIDLDKGDIIWQAYERPVSAFTVDRETLYFSNADGELISMGVKSGNVLLRKKIFNGYGGTPFVIGNRLLLSDSKGPLRLLDKKNAETLSTYSLASTFTASIEAGEDQNKFFVLSDRGYLFYFGLDD